jgi:hypothetical protein
MTAGLWVFVSVLVLNLAGVVLDGILYLTGHITITAMVRRDWSLGTPILVLQVVGLIGIAVHFYAYRE